MSEVTTNASSRRRTGLVTFDQMLAGVAGVATLVWVANVVDPVTFGQFSLVQMAFLVAQVAFRSLISTTVLVHPEDADDRPRSVLASTLVLSLGAGVLCVLAGLGLLVVGSELGGPVAVLGVALPLLLVQDVGRYLAIARQRPGQAVLLDSVWIVAVAVGFVVLQVSGTTSLFWFVAVWAGAGAVPGAAVFVLNGLPSRDGVQWVRERWDFSWRSLVGGLAASGTLLVTSALMTLFSSPLAVAAFRAATLLGSPSMSVQLALSTAASADIARVRRDPVAVARHVRRAMSISAAVGVVNLLVLMLLPDLVGERLLGESWQLVEPLMLAVSLRVLLMAAQSGLRASLLGRRRIQTTMITDVVSIVLVGVCMVLGALWGDVEGALWAMVVGTAVSDLCWWLAILWESGRPDPEDDELEPGAPEGDVQQEPATS